MMGNVIKLKLYILSQHIYKLIFIVDTDAINQKLTLIWFLMSHLKWSIFRDGYISRISEILVLSEIYNRPKYQKISIRDI